MRVIITGGSGLIGRALTDHLCAEGVEVVVLSRSPSKVLGLPSGARAVGWDGRSEEGWGDWVDESTAIVHLAGANVADQRWSAARKRVLRDSRIESGRAVARAIEAAVERGAPPLTLLQGSAVGFYGASGGRTVSEDSEPGQGFLAELCVEWEASTEGVEALGVRRTVLRTGVVLSMAGGALPKMARPFRFFAGGPVGDGRQVLPWIHRVDQVRAMRFLLDNDSTQGPYNLTAPHPVSNRELAEVLGKVLRRPSALPAPAFALQALFGEMSEILLTGQRAIPQRLEAAGFRFHYPHLEDALRDLLR
ncbi:MAG: TIGR01777 family oxidoreductase [Acidobacteriota bacterium]